MATPVAPLHRLRDAFGRVRDRIAAFVATKDTTELEAKLAAADRTIEGLIAEGEKFADEIEAAYPLPVPVTPLTPATDGTSTDQQPADDSSSEDDDDSEDGGPAA